MSNQLTQQVGCDCNGNQITPITQNIPGPQGTAGINAYTLTTSSFLVPVPGLSVQISVVNTSWMVAGQTLYIGAAGYYQVNSVDSATLVTVKNLGYLGNAAPGNTIAGGAGVSPGGVEGAALDLNTISPTTTLGDLIVDNGTGSGHANDVRLPAGANTYVLHADNTQSLGLRYSAIDLSGAGTALFGGLSIANGGTGQSTAQAAFDALAPSTPLLGNLIYYNGTHWVSLPFPVTSPISAFKVLRVNAAATSIEYAWQGLLQSLSSTYTGYTSTTNGLNLTLNTAPISNTGTSLITQAVTPTTTTSKLKVTANVLMTTSASGAFISLLDTTNGVVLKTVATGLVSTLTTLDLVHEYVPGSVSARTLAIFYGTGLSGSTYINGSSANQLFGATSISTLLVEEHA
jgi:hypothetical protein